MPYQSAKQRAYMHIHLPKIAARWDREYGGKVQGDKMPNRKAMFKDALNRAKSQQTGNRPRLDPQAAVNRQQNMRRPGQTPPIIQRDPLNDYQGHNLPVAPGERPPSAPLPDGNPSGNPDPRPMGTVGMRRLGKLGDKNKANDQKGLKPLLRMYMRASQGKKFGGKVFGESKGSSLADFFKATRPYTKGTGYGKMLANLTSQAGPGVIPGVKPEPRPRHKPPRYIPRDNM